MTPHPMTMLERLARDKHSSLFRHKNIRILIFTWSSPARAFQSRRASYVGSGARERPQVGREVEPRLPTASTELPEPGRTDFFAPPVPIRRRRCREASSARCCVGKTPDRVGKTPDRASSRRGRACCRQRETFFYSSSATAR
jgi:hypothetical protein